MKCIAIKQPWAWLIIRPDITDGKNRRILQTLNLLKDVENRTWRTHFRGTLGIHASRQIDLEGYRFIQSNYSGVIHLLDVKEFVYGSIIGSVTVKDVVCRSTSRWYTGPFGWLLSDPRPCQSVPWRGQQSLFDGPDELIYT